MEDELGACSEPGRDEGTWSKVGLGGFLGRFQVLVGRSFCVTALMGTAAVCVVKRVVSWG